MRRQVLVGGLFSAALVALAACGGGSATTAPGATTAPSAAVSEPSVAAASPGTGQAGGFDAGALVTANMAASVIGGSPTKVDMPIGATGGAMSVASYTNPGGDSVTVLVERLPGMTGSLALQAAIAQQGSNGNMQAVSGIGDAAGKVVEDHDATLAFVKGDTIVVLAATAAGSSGSDLESKLESLAQQLTGKL